MGRSVSTPSNAVAKVYLSIANISFEGYDNGFMDDIGCIICKYYPSFYECDSWIGRENHAILENGHAFVTISQYCNVIAICLVPKDEYSYRYNDMPELSIAWCEQVANNWRKRLESQYDCAIRRTGVMSNDVAVYEKVK